MRLAGSCGVLGLLVVVAPALSAGAEGYDPQRRYPPEQLQQDFDLLRGALDEAHPCLNRYTPAFELDRAFDEARAALTRPLTEREFHDLVAPAVGRIRDGHTGMEMSPAYDAWWNGERVPMLPLGMWLDGDRWYVTINASNDPAIQPGDRLLEVNGVTVERLIATARWMVAGDGFSDSGRNHHLNFGALKWTLSEGFGVRPPFKLTMQRGDGPRFTTSVLRSPTPVPGMGPPPTRPAHSFRMLEGDVGLLTIDRFGYDEADTVHRDVFRQLAARDVRHLIIDLRENTGGNGVLALDLLRYLIDRPARLLGDSWAKLRRPDRPSFARHLDPRITKQLLDNNRFRRAAAGRYHFDNSSDGMKPPQERDLYRGALYVLTSGRTFSSASLFVASLKAQRKVVIIGQETGGAEAGFCAGINQKLTLPHTGLRLKLPLFQLRSASTAPDRGRGVIPDHPVHYRWQDRVAGKDLELARALDLIAPKAVLSAPP